MSTGVVPLAPDLFVRKSTGLVREVRPWQAMLINFITGAPMIAIGIGLWGSLSGFPGGSFPLAIVLTIPLALAVVYSFGLMTAAMPRSGGDYILVSRILHPAAGVVSSVCLSLSTFLSLAFEGLALVTLGIAPGLVVLGLVSGNQTLVDWGNTVSSDKNWQFALGSLSIIAAVVIVAAGWTWIKRIVLGGLLFSFAGLVFCALVALVTSKAAFIADFNSFATRYTQDSHSYQSVLTGATALGLDINHGFSFAQTIPMIGVLAGTSIYAYWSTYFAGEMRQASTMKTPNRMAMASGLILASALVFSVIFFNGWGQDFLAASFGGAFPSKLGHVAPSYFYLTSAQLGVPVIAALLSLSFVVFFPIWMAQTVLQPPRTFFAWAFDRIAPKVVTRVSPNGVPTVATVVTGVLCLVAFAWAIYGAKNLIQVIVYTVLIQLVTHSLIGISAIVFPYRRPQLYRASVSARNFLGVPVTVYAGIGAILTTAFLYFCYFNWPFFGLADKSGLWLWLGGSIVFGLVWYYVAVFVRRREGIDVTRVFAEIPPE